MTRVGGKSASDLPDEPIEIPTNVSGTPMEAADGLRNAMVQFSDRILRLQGFAKATRRRTVLLFVSVVLDVVLSLGLGGLAVGLRYTQCQSGNNFRALDLARWSYLLNTFPRPTDPARRVQYDDFRTYIEAADAPRDCSIWPF